jgi:hypothetical protein
VRALNDGICARLLTSPKFKMRHYRRSESCLLGCIVLPRRSHCASRQSIGRPKCGRGRSTPESGPPQQLAIISADLDRPGELGAIASLLGELGANILEVDHRRLFLDVPAKGANLDVTVETRDPAHAEAIMRALARGGYRPARLAARASN